MIASLLRLFRPPPAPGPAVQPEHAWRVWDSGDMLHCAHDGKEEVVRWSEVAEIRIVTNDQGPWFPDVFWHFRSVRGELVFPQMALGEKEVIERVMKLPGFDFAASNAAMTSAQNAEFRVWTSR